MPIAAAAELSLVPIVPQPLERSRHAGPGWFDSSWDLRRGLEVREGGCEDALFAWLESWLQPSAGGGGLSLSAM